MVAGRAAERIGQALALEHQRRAMGGGGRARPRRGPGLGGDGCGAVAQVPAALAHHAVRIGNGRQVWPAEGEDIGGGRLRRARQALPALPQRREELDVAAVMDEGQRIAEDLRRRHDRAAEAPDAFQQHVDALRDLRNGLRLARDDEFAGCMGALRVVEDSDHRFAVPPFLLLGF